MKNVVIAKAGFKNVANVTCTMEDRREVLLPVGVTRMRNKHSVESMYIYTYIYIFSYVKSNKKQPVLANGLLHYMHRYMTTLEETRRVSNYHHTWNLLLQQPQLYNEPLPFISL